MKMIWLLLSLFCAYSSAASWSEIVNTSTPSIVYLEVTDDKGNFMDSGSGFIVSHDGYIITVAHIKPQSGHKLWATVGQREGTRYPLSFRDEDEKSDVSLWQLPQAAVCRSALTISTKPVKVLERVLVLGFPSKDGLTPSGVGINNLSTPDHGFYKADGFLRPGNSGGPVLNEEGQVVAIVQGGTMPGTENNDLIPISLAIALINKRNVKAGINSPIQYDNSCFTVCPHESHGVIGWASQTQWGPVNTGWLGGGSNQTDQCNGLIAAALVGKSGMQIDLLAGKQGKWEDSKKDIMGHVEYMYFCQGLLKSGPIFARKQSPACPLKQ